MGKLLCLRQAARMMARLAMGLTAGRVNVNKIIGCCPTAPQAARDGLPYGMERVVGEAVSGLPRDRLL